MQGKLDGYRADRERGKTLNEDQKAAIEKYDEVIGTLEFARELSGQFAKLVVDEDKERKKVCMEITVTEFIIALF